MANRRGSYIQPNYQAWKSIQIGTTRGEVIALLGEPPRDRYKMFAPYVTYGWIDFRASPHPRMYRFMLDYDDNDRVFLKSDPFMGELSPDGKPSKPEIILPQQGARYEHFPRVLDIRWNPCSGAYPMTYSLEIEIAQPWTTDFRKFIYEEEIKDPYWVQEFPGSQPGRIRVRGRNEFGVGEWSDYRTFDFTVT